LRLLARVMLALLLAALPLTVAAAPVGDHSSSRSSSSALITIPGLGVAQGVVLSGSRYWYGLPFAAPPVGKLRWRSPQPPLPWQGVREASMPRPQCMQSSPGWRGASMSEDCLYLNVFAAPEPPPQEGGGGAKQLLLRPVMLWIHGGGYNGGDAVQGRGLFNGSGLVESQGVVVVTVDYRLNAFGFLGSERLRDAAAGGSTGVFGMQDQRASMQWVQQHIHLFGGDKDRVTIFGCSAGAASVSVQYVMPRSFGLFNGAIAESGEMC
jgi:para-nitrobenzyl esterase